MSLFASDLVRPLKTWDHWFLQVLLTRFTLVRMGQGIQFRASFDDDSLAVGSSDAKDEVLARIEDFERKSNEHQARLNDFLLAGHGDRFEFDDPGFPFRYASGGTPPILRIGDKEYCCLFYRDIFPVGWNIANGGCDTRAELLNPLEAIDRELREELIILDTTNRRRYVFAGDADKQVDRPEFAIARRIWKEYFPGLDISSFSEVLIPLKWISGPDSLRLRVNGHSCKPVSGCFLNINAKDFGIEIDNVAKIHIDDDAVLCDGELWGDKLLNQPIGLFEVERLSGLLAENATEFLPDRLFFDGTDWPGEKPREVILNRFVPRVQRDRGRIAKQQFDQAPRKFDLCPATRSILCQYQTLTRPRPKVRSRVRPANRAKDVDVFICFGGHDGAIARKLHGFLAAKGVSAFCSEESRTATILPAIDNALDSATYLVAVGTRHKNLIRDWPQYEYTCFHVDILNKPRKRKEIIPFVSFLCSDLPKPLVVYRGIQFDQRNPDASFPELVERIMGPS